MWRFPSCGGAVGESTPNVTRAAGLRSRGRIPLKTRSDTYTCCPILDLALSRDEPLWIVRGSIGLGLFRYSSFSRASSQVLRIHKIRTLPKGVGSLGASFGVRDGRHSAVSPGVQTPRR